MINQQTPEITLIEAVNLALHYEMEHDNNVVLLGEDVGDNGGVFRATVGLKEKFGLRRVIDTPLAEALIGGVAVGMATQGFKTYCRISISGLCLSCDGTPHLPRCKNEKPH